MKKFSILLVGLVVSLSCIAAPQKIDAQKWLKDFRDAKDKTRDAIFITKLEKRQEHSQVLKNLDLRAQKLFGQDMVFSDCAMAATHLSHVWQNEIQLLNKSDNVTLGGLTNAAFETGQSYGYCRDVIDGIK